MINIPYPEVLRFTFEELDEKKQLFDAPLLQEWLPVMLKEEGHVPDGYGIDYILTDHQACFVFVVLSPVGWGVEVTRKIITTEKVVWT